MKRTFAYTLLLLIAIAVSFGFSTTKDEGKVHLKITKEENGEKSVFEKVYSNMDALKADEELKDFDVLIDQWANKDNHIFIHKDHDGDEIHKKAIIKKSIDGDEEFTWISDEDEEIHKDGKRIVVKKIGSDEDIVEVEGEKIIKIKTDGEEKVFTITSEGEGENTMVWIDKDGNKTELTEENIKKMAEDGEQVEVHKKVEVIVSVDGEEKKNVFIVKGEGESELEVEVEVEKEVDEEGNEVVKNKKVWITKDGKKVELDDGNPFEFKSEGEKIIVKVDGETMDIEDFSGGKYEGDDVMIIKSKGSLEGGVKQTMDVNIEEKDGEKYIEIDIKRKSALNVMISEIEKDDAELSDVKVDLKNNLKASQLSYFPNPNNGKFSLRFSLDQEEEVTVKVMDILGNEVYKERLLDFSGNYDNEINLRGKEKGIYILQISQKKKALTRKILIE